LLADIGVLLSFTALISSLECRFLLGVAWICPSVLFPCDLEGVPSSFSTKRSNNPRTRPSRCGVGAIDVTDAGLNSFLDMDGVAMKTESRACPGFLEGVSACLARFDGVWAGAVIALRFFEEDSSCFGGGILPEIMSRSLL